MKEFFMKWYRKKHTAKEKIVGTVLGSGIFIIGLTLLIVVLPFLIDAHLNLPNFEFQYNVFFALFLIITGLLLAGWCVWDLFKRGRGSPFPVIPTQKLIITGPYKYCRNPMTLGLIIYCLGIVIWQGSFSTLFLVVLFSVLSVVYAKLVEEKELEARFGEEYRTYKKNTPFIFPKLEKSV